MNRFALLVCAASLLLAGCVLPAPDELSFGGTARLDGEGELTVSTFFDAQAVPLPNGPQGPNPTGDYYCRTHLILVAAEGDPADGCSDCAFTLLVDFDVVQIGSVGTCGGIGSPGVPGFPSEAEFPPYSDGDEPPRLPGPVQGVSIGVVDPDPDPDSEEDSESVEPERGVWWNGDGEWALWIEGEPGENSFDGEIHPEQWRNSGSNSWIREELNFSWTTVAE